jgi:hypothetical protein
MPFRRPPFSGVRVMPFVVQKGECVALFVAQQSMWTKLDWCASIARGHPVKHLGSMEDAGSEGMGFI